MTLETLTHDTATTSLPQILKHVSQLSFSWYDYILFTLMLSFSVIIGIYFGCFGTKQSTADEYLMGNKKMKVFPISVSLAASHISGITLLAIPADIYRYGSTYYYAVPSVGLVVLVTIYVYLPVFFKLQITSTYEYLERRFDSTNRLFASFLYALGLLFYLPIVIYVPALAFSAATGINIHYITPVICGVCIFYTTLGGLKAVVWTDTLQFTVTTGAVFTVVLIGVKTAGGFGAVWKTALEGHRLDIFDFDPDPTKRDSFWIVFIGMTIHWLATSAIHQSCVQKYLSVSTFHESKLCVIFFFAGIVVVISFSVFTGLIMYSRYFSCDPFATGAVLKNDQLLPYYIMDVASHIPGLPGLFIAGVFCAALSTLSASLNCLAGTLFEDFVLKFTGPLRREETKALILKLLVVIAGVTCTSLVFIVERLGSILALAVALGAITSGPLMGMFTLGILFPKASSKGAFYGAIIGLLFSSWVIMMSQYYKAEGLIPDVPKPTSTENCAVTEIVRHLENVTEFVESFPENATNLILSRNATEEFNLNPPEPTNKVFFLFRISFYYYTLLGTVVTMTCGLVISYLVKNDDPPVDRDLLSPIIYFLLPDEKVVDKKSKDYYSHEAVHLVTNTEKSKNEEIRA